MNIAAAEKEIRALARRLGIRAHQVRTALESMEGSNSADDIGTPAAASAGNNPGETNETEPSRQEADRADARQEQVTRQGRKARLLTRNDLAPRAPVLKDQAVEHEGYRRLVAARPCINCRIHGRSQAAHENAGKAKGMKTDDRRTFPLCADSPLFFGCHTKFDRYRLFRNRAEHAAMGATWAKQTREEIRAEGLWPKDLEYPED